MGCFFFYYFLFPLPGKSGDATTWREIKTVGNRRIAHILKQTCVADHIDQSEKSLKPPEALPAVGLRRPETLPCRNMCPSSPSSFCLPLRRVHLLQVLVGGAGILGPSNRVQPPPGDWRSPALGRPMAGPGSLVGEVRQGSTSGERKGAASQKYAVTST